MSRKQPRVPEMRETKPNRMERRHPERAEDEALSRDEAARRDLPPDHEAPPKRQEIYRQGPQDVTDVRAKNSGHKKKTADNWNQ